MNFAVSSFQGWAVAPRNGNSGQLIARILARIDQNSDLEDSVRVRTTWAVSKKISNNFSILTDLKSLPSVISAAKPFHCLCRDLEALTFHS